MKTEIGTFHNAFGHQVAVVVNHEKENKWEFGLELRCGDRTKYRSPVDKGRLSANYLDVTLHQDQEIAYVTFKIFASDECWHGTILMKALFQQIQLFERENKIKVHHIMGELSTADQKNNWPRSIPFYLDLPKRLSDDDGCVLKVSVGIYYKDDISCKRNSIGAMVNDVDAFMNGEEDGYIVYNLM